MQEKFDKFAILLSGICALHCIFTPIAASIIPIFTAVVHHGEDIHEFWFHQFIIIFILPISIFALIMGFRTHKRLLPIFIAAIGLFILTFVALFAEELIHHHMIEHKTETLLTITGGIIHAIGHIINFQASRKKHLHYAT